MAISQNFPNTRPSLNLNFARSQTLDPRITFSRTNPTATYVDDNGLIVAAGADEPRFDHDPTTGESLGLLVEEKRTNLLPHSVVSSTNWSDNQSTVTNNATTAPDGTNTAARIQVHSPGSSNGYVTKQNIGVTTGTEYTFSFYVKSQSGSSGTWGINIFDHGGANLGHHKTDVDITGEWTRVKYSYTPTSGTINVYVSDDRDNTASISDAYVWGAQLEAGAFPTSYIPTSGSQATRSPDSVSMTGTNFSDWYNQSEGTFVTLHRQNDTKDTTVNYGIYSLSNSPTNTDRLRFLAGAGSVPVFNTVISNSTVAYVNVSSLLVINLLDREGELIKSSTRYSDIECSAVIEGSDLATDDTNIVIPSTLNNMIIGAGGAGLKQLCGHISQLTYYPTRLSNTVLQSLTK